MGMMFRGSRLVVFALALLVLVLVASALFGSVAVARADSASAAKGYVVVYRDGVRKPGAATALRERRHGFWARLRYSAAVKGFAARLSQRQVQALRRDPQVASVTPDRTVHATGGGPLVAGEFVPAGLRRIEAATQTTALQASSARVAVLDTGIDLNHPDLDVVDGDNCISPGAPAEDDNGHGTHVAGTIAAKNNGFGFVGVAPGTRVVSVKVLDSTGSGAYSQIICGIDWVTATLSDTDLSNDVLVANMSLTGLGDPVESCASTTDPLHAAICRSTAAGVTYAVAAGNSGWDFDYAANPDVPASYPEVLTVTAMSDSDGAPGGLGGAPACYASNGDDQTASFSNYATTAAGAAHTVAAPGVCIESTAMGGGYEVRSGTSMATPHVTATVALCLGTSVAAGPCAGLEPAQIIARIRSQAEQHTNRLSGYGFQGDPLRALAGRYFGYLATALDIDPPTPTLTQPTDGSTTTDSTPLLSGVAGAAAGDAPTISVQISQGTGTGGPLVGSFSTTRSNGSWSLNVLDADALPEGAYTVSVTQDDDAGNPGHSAAATFTVTGTQTLTTQAPSQATSSAPGPPVAGRATSASSVPKQPAKLSVARATVSSATNRLDVLAPITKRASGTVEVSFTAAGRTYRFTQPIDARRGYIRFRRRIPQAQARLGTGILSIAYAGDDDTRPQRVRLRAAAQASALHPTRPVLVAGRLRATGTISMRARGVVRVQIEYMSAGRAVVDEFSTRIRDGRWRLNQALPDDIRQAIAARQGTVQSQTLFTGYLPKNLRGEMYTYQVIGNP